MKNIMCTEQHDMRVAVAAVSRVSENKAVVCRVLGSSRANRDVHPRC